MRTAAPAGSGPILLGIDVGTSSVKLVATDRDGLLVGDASLRYPLATGDGSGAEQDAELWWDAVTRLAPALIAGRPVASVAVTSQAPTLVPVAADGSAAGPALSWLDRRAVREGARILDLVPDSRNGADPFFGTAKLPWLLAERPAIAARTAHVLAANGFIVGRLTGVASLDDTTASLMHGFDEASGDFDDRLRAAEPSLALLPPIVPATRIVGTVTAAASAATGIPVGTPVAAGAIDAVGSALEAGSLAAGDDLVEMTGFSSVTLLSVPAGTAVPGFIHARHCIPGVDLLITAQVTAGATIDWVNGLDGSRDLRDTDALLARTRPSRLTMVPSLAGERTPRWQQDARGVIDGVDLTTDGTELMLAAMEGNALALSEDVDTLRSRGFAIDRVLATGGGSASRAWLQIKADVLGVPVARPASGHGAAQGASYLAGLAVGLHEGVDALRSFASTIEVEVTPNPDRHEAYREKQRWASRLRELNTRSTKRCCGESMGRPSATIRP